MLLTTDLRSLSQLEIPAVEAVLTRENLPRAIMVDCSHDNSGRRPERQADVLHDVIGQVAAGNRSVFGVMLESNLVAGRQPIVNAQGKLRYGVSVTDGCLDWPTTEACLRNAHASLGCRFDSGARRVGFRSAAVAVK